MHDRAEESRWTRNLGTILERTHEEHRQTTFDEYLKTADGDLMRYGRALRRIADKYDLHFDGAE